MEYTCQHCQVNLDEVDIYMNIFVLEYINNSRTREIAGLYGWS